MGVTNGFLSSRLEKNCTVPNTALYSYTTKELITTDIEVRNEYKSCLFTVIFKNKT